MEMCFSDVLRWIKKKKKERVKTILLKTHLDSSLQVVGLHKQQDSYKKHHCKQYTFPKGHSLIKPEIGSGSSDL